MNYYVTRTKEEFNGSCLKQDKIMYTHGEIVNIYTVYEIVGSYNDDNYPTLKKVLFGAVKLTRNADINKYRYSGYRIGFDGKGYFSHPRVENGKNVILFGVYMSSSTKIDIDILILGKGPTQRLEHSLIRSL